MTQWGKLKLARAHLKALGLGSRAGAPPILRVFWLFHIPVPPLMFWRFGSVVLFTGTFLGACVGVVLWLALWAGKGTSPWFVFGVPAVIGAAFGLSNARRCRDLAHKYRLPLWSQYSPEPTPRPVTAASSCEVVAHSNAPVMLSWSTKSVRCPHCGSAMPVRLLAFMPRLFGPHFTCPSCHERCALRFSTRMFAYACGFIASMAVLALLIAAIIISQYINIALVMASVIVSVAVWSFVQMYVSLRFCTLVKSWLL